MPLAFILFNSVYVMLSSSHRGKLIYSPCCHDQIHCNAYYTVCCMRDNVSANIMIHFNVLFTPKFYSLWYHSKTVWLYSVEYKIIFWEMFSGHQWASILFGSQHCSKCIYFFFCSTEERKSNRFGMTVGCNVTSNEQFLF